MNVTRIEKGYTRVENGILESISKINLSPYESRVLHYLWRKTYGWQKNMDRIALAQFAKDIGIDRRLVSRTLRTLESRRLIEIQNLGRWQRAYGFQKDPEKWRNSKRKRKSVIPIDDKNCTSIGAERENGFVLLASSGVTASALSSPEMSKLSSPEMHTKENTKEKNISSPGSQKGTNEIDPDFGIFWSKEGYPKRVAKGAALRAWNSAKKKGILPPIEKILEVLKKQKNSEQWQKDNGKFIPHPATWLNQQRWDDELPEGKVTGW